MNSTLFRPDNFFEDILCRFLKRRGISSILVALSGGADSTALLRGLLSAPVRRLFPQLRIEAVHCNFHLRGEESDRDMRFCGSLCAGLGIPLETVEFDTGRYRREKGVSLEMACRELRYDRFRQILREKGFDRVAVAHNADDNIETLLLNLFRGSGVSGLGGMEKDNGWVIRPLLDITRAEIERYLSDLGQTHIEDSSNTDTTMRRNFIRHELLPLLQTRYPGIRASLTRSLHILNEEKNLIAESIKEMLAGPEGELSVDSVRGSVAPVTLVHRFISPHGGTTLQAEEIARNVLESGEGGAIWKLGEKGILERRIDHLVITCRDIPAEPLRCEHIPFGPEGMARARLEGNDVLYLPNPLTDYEVRHWRSGDRMLPLGLKGSALVADLMRDLGLSRTERGRRWIVCRKSDDAVVWVQGVRRSRLDLLSPDAAEAFRIS